MLCWCFLTWRVWADWRQDTIISLENLIEDEADIFIAPKTESTMTFAILKPNVVACDIDEMVVATCRCKSGGLSVTEQGLSE